MTADRWHPASTRARKARRRYWPRRPGTIASACVEPSSARSRPMTADRILYEISAGTTIAVATPCAIALRSSRTSQHLNREDVNHRQLAVAVRLREKYAAGLRG